MVLAEDGTLYTFGDNSLGQLGRPSRPEHCPEDWIVRGDAGAPLKLERVAAGLGHCLAVTQDGQVGTLLPCCCQESAREQQQRCVPKDGGMLPQHVSLQSEPCSAGVSQTT